MGLLSKRFERRLFHIFVRRIKVEMRINADNGDLSDGCYDLGFLFYGSPTYC